MLQNSLNSSVMAGMGGVSLPEASGGGEVETAGRMLDKHINYDSCFPSLTDKLQISAKGEHLQQ